MKFNKPINNKFTNPANVSQLCQSTIGKINRLFVSDREYFGQYFFIEETSNLQFGQITGHSGVQNYWTEIEQVQNNGFFIQKKLETEDLYNIEVNYNLSGQNKEVRDLVEAIISIKNILYLIQDSNLKWYLIGENGGTINLVDGNLSGDDDNNSINILTKVNQRHLIREVSQTYINTYVTPITLTSLCDLTFEQLCDLTNENLCNLLP